MGRGAVSDRLLVWAGGSLGSSKRGTVEFSAEAAFALGQSQVGATAEAAHTPPHNMPARRTRLGLTGQTPPGGTLPCKKSNIFAAVRRSRKASRWPSESDDSSATLYTVRMMVPTLPSVTPGMRRSTSLAASCADVATAPAVASAPSAAEEAADRVASVVEPPEASAAVSASSSALTRSKSSVPAASASRGSGSGCSCCGVGESGAVFA